MRFHVFVSGFGPNGNPQLKTDTAAGIPSAGFNACSIPELSQEIVEYREGHFNYTRKFSGIPSVSNVTFSRGVALRDGSFFAWMKDAVEGNGEYRADMIIRQFHRSAKPQSTSTTTNELMKVEPDPDTGYIDYKCFNCIPARNKPAGDLNSTASEVSITELELAVEYFRIEENS